MDEKSFKYYGLSPEILESLRKLEYKEPTKVQVQVIPQVLEGRDVIVRSQTGSGKTASFGIPVCEKIKTEFKDPQALILTPTRELCVQVKEDISNIGRLKRIRCAAVFGKQPYDEQTRELKQRVHIIAGTPGRVIDHIERGNIITGSIKYLIIDEADKMLNMGFIGQIETIISLIPKERITLLFSATLPDKVRYLCDKYMHKPVSIEINHDVEIPEGIEQQWYKVSEDDKFDLLNRIFYIENPESSIIFCRTKENTDMLYKELKNRGYSCNAIHGGMLQNERLHKMQSFKKGEYRFLAATDIAARGLDIEDITHIINYDIPLEDESYVHRIGRTGRKGKKGKAITFVCPDEVDMLHKIEGYIGSEIQYKEIPSIEEAEKGKKAFNANTKYTQKIRADKGSMLSKDITKIYINAGKSKKIRTGDIVGAITSIDGVKVEDVGIIDLRDNLSYIDILNGKGDLVLEALQYTTVKGKTVRVQKAIK
ncbi:ATP-dependent RNA helicase DbpA [Oxobacter pfennigii]|uniref:ATP-dependent RNA helicase DbpA n=1 Tax=Oxobacter pfennigii TaxID=36849 RepID=A0A0P8WMM6_9CLOT|nr:DEAD/DEAH box helicase [Oxobacter pfennigii]KPU43747.1 ATP-dependent RNA helicase DbpA [Oxobacter pfennigii]